MFPFPKLFLLRIICSPPFGPLLLSHARVTISLTICFQRFFSVLQLVAGHVGSYIEGPARLPLRKPTLHPPVPRSPAPPAWTHIEGPERLSRRFPTPFLSGSRSFARLLPFLCCGFSSANASLCFISAFLLRPGSCSALHGLIYRRPRRAGRRRSVSVGAFLSWPTSHPTGSSHATSGTVPGCKSRRGAGLRPQSHVAKRL